MRATKFSVTIRVRNSCACACVARKTPRLACQGRGRPAPFTLRRLGYRYPDKTPIGSAAGVPSKTMRKMATLVPGMRRDSFGWRSLAWVLAVAFALQSHVVQTHIHGAPQSFASGGFSKAAPQSLSHGKAPLGDSGVDCPYCQAIVHAGSFLAPTAPLLSLPSISVACATQQGCLRALGLSQAHSWQSRAPPQR